MRGWTRAELRALGIIVGAFLAAIAVLAIWFVSTSDTHGCERLRLEAQRAVLLQEIPEPLPARCEA